MSLRDSVLKIVADHFPDLFLRGVFEYRAAAGSAADGRVDLVPVRSKWLPDVPLADVWPGVAGYRVGLPKGASVLLAFIDQDRTRPACVGFMPGSAVEPDSFSIEATGTATINGASVDLGLAESPVIRDGDQVIIQVEPGPTPIAAGTIRLVVGTTYPQVPLLPTRVKA